MDDAEHISLGPLQLPYDSERVTDADEEIFILYSNLKTTENSTSGTFRGLGHFDSHKDFLTIRFELEASTLSRNNDSSKKSRRRRKTGIAKNIIIPEKTVEISIAQDTTALRSRKGDTGSVLWKASIDFANLILSQIHSRTSKGLFNQKRLLDAHVLELGGGTGMLSIAFSSIVKQYTVTDINALVPLLRKTISANFNGWPHIPVGQPGGNITVEELDWQVLEAASPGQRAKLHAPEPVDLILVVDCIYHPSLLHSLIETIDYLAIPNQTAVLVLSELRSDDVLRFFLEIWLQKQNWNIWHIDGSFLGPPYVMWVGWKVID